MNSGRHILIKILDLVDRKTLSRLVERYDAESRVRHFGCPKPLSNGLWPVADWREFVRLRGLKAGKVPVGNEEALKARKLLAEVEERELRIAVKRGEYVPIHQVKSEWIGHVARATSILRAKFENELPPIFPADSRWNWYRTRCRASI
jgi:hypothetical protein